MLKEIRGQVLVWFGIVGGALTIVHHWSNDINLADWVRWLVENFFALVHSFWRLLGALIGLEVPSGVAEILTLICFYISLTIGTFLTIEKMNKISFHVLYIQILITLVVIVPAFFEFYYIDVTFLIIPALPFALLALFVDFETTLASAGPVKTGQAIILTYAMLYVNAVVFKNGMDYLIPDDILQLRHKLIIIIATVLTCLPVLTLLLTPPRELTKRLAFFFLGVAIIFGLSEVSILAGAGRTAATSAAATQQR